MSETEPLLQTDIPNTTEKESFNYLYLIGSILSVIAITLVVLWGIVIPHYIQKEIDMVDGSYLLYKLQITEIGNRKIHFDTNAAIIVSQGAKQSSLTASIAENLVDIQLCRKGNNLKSIISFGTPQFYYTSQISDNRSLFALLNSQNYLSWRDKFTIKNIEIISELISDFASNNSNVYTIGFKTHPKVSIPGIPGSWKLNFFKSFDFLTACNVFTTKSRAG